MEAMKPVKIYSAKDRIEAEMLLELLKRNHIQAYRQGVGSGGYMDIYAGYSIYGEDIFVDEEDMKNATELIQEVTAQVKPREEEEGQDD